MTLAKTKFNAALRICSCDIYVGTMAACGREAWHQTVPPVYYM